MNETAPQTTGTSAHASRAASPAERRPRGARRPAWGTTCTRRTTRRSSTTRPSGTTRRSSTTRRVAYVPRGVEPRRRCGHELRPAGLGPLRRCAHAAAADPPRAPRASGGRGARERPAHGVPGPAPVPALESATREPDPWAGVSQVLPPPSESFTVPRLAAGFRTLRVSEIPVAAVRAAEMVAPGAGASGVVGLALDRPPAVEAPVDALPAGARRSTPFPPRLSRSTSFRPGLSRSTRASDHHGRVRHAGGADERPGPARPASDRGDRGRARRAAGEPRPARRRPAAARRRSAAVRRRAGHLSRQRAGRRSEHRAGTGQAPPPEPDRPRVAAPPAEPVAGGLRRVDRHRVGRRLAARRRRPRARRVVARAGRTRGLRACPADHRDRRGRARDPRSAWGSCCSVRPEPSAAW